MDRVYVELTNRVMEVNEALTRELAARAEADEVYIARVTNKRTNETKVIYELPRTLYEQYRTAYPRAFRQVTRKGRAVPQRRRTAAPDLSGKPTLSESLERGTVRKGARGLTGRNERGARSRQ